MLIIASNKKNKKLVKKLIKKINDKNLCEVYSLINDNKIQLCESLVNLHKEGKWKKAIIIDSYGIFPFMYMSKHKNMIVAQIADEHSAKMTSDHNNSNVLSFGSKIITRKIMFSMIKAFVEQDYSGGRHQVRLDMLDKLLEKETN